MPIKRRPTCRLTTGIAGTLLATSLACAPRTSADIRPLNGASGFAPPAQLPTAFVDVSVVPMDREQILEHRTVLVSGGKIVRVAPAQGTSVPSGYLKIDGRGHFLLPGLVDAHVHTNREDSGEPSQWLPIFLAYGVTTVFNLYGDSAQIALRERVKAGTILAPAFYTSGGFFNENRVKNAEEVERDARLERDMGVDFFKIGGNGVLADDVYRRLGALSREYGIPLIGHAPRNLGLEPMFEYRNQVMLAHAEELIYAYFKKDLDTAKVRPLGERMVAAGIWLTPTLSTYEGMARQWGLPPASSLPVTDTTRYLTPEMVRFWTEGNPYTFGDSSRRSVVAARAVFLRHAVGLLHAAGVRILAGTDTPLPVMAPGMSLHQELASLRSAGLSPFEALAAATRNPGQFVFQYVPGGRNTPFGTVAEGSRADLLLVDANPLANPEALKRPLGVMTVGRWLPRSALDSILRRMARKP